jgi:hypothetical protein
MSPPSPRSEIKPSKNLAELTLTPVSADFLIGLFFEPEGEGDMFFRNVGFSFSLNYTAL